MRTRCIVFLPLAALITAALFVLSASIVWALEATLASERGISAIEVSLHETECETLRRRIGEVAREASVCEAHPGCLRSPILCPIVMREELAREYEALRSAVEARCTGLPTYATNGWGVCSRSDGVCRVEAQRCEPSRSWSEEIGSPRAPWSAHFGTVRGRRGYAVRRVRCAGQAGTSSGGTSDAPSPSGSSSKRPAPFDSRHRPI